MIFREKPATAVGAEAEVRFPAACLPLAPKMSAENSSTDAGSPTTAHKEALQLPTMSLKLTPSKVCLLVSHHLPYNAIIPRLTWNANRAVEKFLYSAIFVFPIPCQRSNSACAGFARSLIVFGGACEPTIQDNTPTDAYPRFP